MCPTPWNQQAVYQVQHPSFESGSPSPILTMVVDLPWYHNHSLPLVGAFVLENVACFPVSDTWVFYVGSKLV